MNKFLLSLFLLFLTFSATAQIDEKEKLEQRKEQLLRESAELKIKLQNEKKKEKSVLKEIYKPLKSYFLSNLIYFLYRYIPI